MNGGRGDGADMTVRMDGRTAMKRGLAIALQDAYRGRTMGGEMRGWSYKEHVPANAV